jgi:hypothetical protein
MIITKAQLIFTQNSEQITWQFVSCKMRMAASAKAEFYSAISRRHKSNIKMPCMMVVNFLCQRLRYRTLITEVTGVPPISPIPYCPNLCSIKFEVQQLSGSSLSTASMPSNVSKLATMAMVMATFQTSGLVGIPIAEIKESRKFADRLCPGKVTSVRSTAPAGALRKNVVDKNAHSTTNNGAGSTAVFYFLAAVTPI